MQASNKMNKMKREISVSGGPNAGVYKVPSGGGGEEYQVGKRVRK